MHDYVYEANNFPEPDPQGKPVGSWGMFFGQLIFAAYFKVICVGAIPSDLDEAYAPYAFVIARAFGLALGIHLTGNNGRVKSAFWPVFMAALFGEATSEFMFDIGTLLLFLPLNVYWRIREWVTPPEVAKKSGCCMGTMKHFFKGMLIGMLILSFLYFNATITQTNERTQQEETIYLRDSLRHIWNSPAVQDFFNTMGQLYEEGQRTGWSNVWDQLVEAMDVDGEDHAYRVLGLDKGTTTFSDVKRAHRRLARKYHPDKCVEVSCEEQFMKIQEAYETLKRILEG